MVARLAALVAVDAPTTSYVMNADAAARARDHRGGRPKSLGGGGPVVDTAGIVTAAERITEALGFVIELAVAELAAEARGRGSSRNRQRRK